MSEKVLNRPVLEKIAKDVMRIEDAEMIEAFVNMFVYTILLD